MSIQDRLDDAELLWRHGRESGAMLSALVAIAAIAKQRYPDAGDRERFESFMRAAHEWTISIEFRGQQTELDHLFYKWMRCELVHDASLPIDLRIDHQFADPASLAVRAGGEPEKVAMITPAWFGFLTDLIYAHLGKSRSSGDGRS